VPAHRAVPQPKAGEVLIKVAAAGVNRPDVAQRLGRYPPPPGASDIPGLEVAGEIVALGTGVTQWTVGARVCALIAGGGYAEYATAPAGSCLPTPSGLSDVEAAGIPETFFTVWHNVFERAALKSGETILIHGGSSGIGTTAIQLAKAFNATVVVTAGSDDKCDACRKLGADVAINYKTTDFVENVKALPGGGVDVVLDMVAGDYLPRNIKCLKTDGRMALIAILGGSKGELDMGQVLMKRLQITGSTLRARDSAFKARLAGELRTRVWPLFESGKVRPHVHKTFPLAAAAQAHALMESSAHVGKLVLKM